MTGLDHVRKRSGWRSGAWTRSLIGRVDLACQLVS